MPLFLDNLAPHLPCLLQHQRNVARTTDHPIFLMPETSQDLTSLPQALPCQQLEEPELGGFCPESHDDWLPSDFAELIKLTPNKLVCVTRVRDLKTTCHLT